MINPGGLAQLRANASGGTPPFAYSWSPALGLNNAAIADPFASPNKTTRYTLAVTDSRNQTAGGSVIVRVQSPLMALAYPPTISPGESSTLSATGGGGIAPFSYAWEPTDTLSDPIAANPTASPLVTTTYLVTRTDSLGAQHASAVTLDVRVEAGAFATQPIIATGESTRLAASARGGTPPYTFLWSPAGGLSDPTSWNPLATPAVPTVYSLVVTDAAGGTAASHTTVIFTTTTLNITASANPPVIFSGGAAQLGASVVSSGTPPYTYAWTPAATLTGSTTANPIARPTATTTYTVVVTDAGGRTGLAQTTLTVIPFGP
jgi:hypothetical protein